MIGILIVSRDNELQIAQSNNQKEFTIVHQNHPYE